MLYEVIDGDESRNCSGQYQRKTGKKVQDEESLRVVVFWKFIDTLNMISFTEEEWER